MKDRKFKIGQKVQFKSIKEILLLLSNQSNNDSDLHIFCDLYESKVGGQCNGELFNQKHIYTIKEYPYKWQADTIVLEEDEIHWKVPEAWLEEISPTNFRRVQTCENCKYIELDIPDIGIADSYICIKYNKFINSPKDTICDYFEEGNK